MNDLLRERLEALKTSSDGGAVKIEEVDAVVQDFLDALTAEVGTAERELYDELDALAQYIRTAKAEIAALRPDEIRAEYIPTAADELDAIVGATAGATHEILDAMEVLEEMSAELPAEAAAKIMNVTTRVYEACNFQDITGQRTTKVIRALKHIEEKIDGLVTAFGAEIEKIAPDQARTARKTAPDDEAALLNGPQLEGEGVSQADIDALFS